MSRASEPCAERCGSERNGVTMRFGVLGTGMVGRAIAAALAARGHEVMIGTRDVDELMARTESGRGGSLPPFRDWHADRPDIQVRTFSEAAVHGEMVFNATSGSASLDVLAAAGAESLEGKVLVDLSNPLDSSGGFPPSLSVSNTDSLAEQIQRQFPGARVVKTLNTVNASLMVDPGSLAEGDHTVFVSGNDAGAKERVVAILRELGWRDVIDLGDISTARGPEMYLPLWLRLMGALGTASFNIKVVR